jgi:ABC transport system ATP-binding/permease protein
VLELHEITLEVPDGAETRRLLNRIHVAFPTGSFCAVIGPSGCGKSTLIKTIAGLIDPTAGSLKWLGRDLSQEEDFAVGELAYVPQFSIAHESLTVRESIDYALHLRVGGLKKSARQDRAETVIEQVSLTEFQDRRVHVLSGGQKRRLALALELISEPSLMLCDEVTSGLDPKSEEEIVRLLADLAHTANRLVLSITHSLRHLALYDTVTVLCAGRLCFHDRAHRLLRYFEVTEPDAVFTRLAEHPAEHWARRWAELHDLPFDEPAEEEATP